MGWHMHEMGGGAWLYLFLLILIFVVAAIFVVRWSLRHEDKEKTALDILKERYARGEIAKTEFEKMKRDITEV